MIPDPKDADPRDADPRDADPRDAEPRDAEPRDAAVGQREVVVGDDLFATHERSGLDNVARSVAEGSATTLFQPGAMALLEDSTLDVVGTRTADVSSPIRPALPADIAPYFLLLGARPGQGRIRLTAARTTFGRHGADVCLLDDAMSNQHFRVDAMGAEFFVRDLESRNGTLLNGHRVRYSELLPGDEIQAGNSLMIFRLEGDGLTERPNG